MSKKPRKPKPSPDGAAATAPAVVEGRDVLGRFGPGNPGGVGNPFAKRTAELRAAMMEAVTRDDVLNVARGLLADANSKDPDIRIPSRKELLDRVLGKPVQPLSGDGDENKMPILLIGTLLDSGPSSG